MNLLGRSFIASSFRILSSRQPTLHLSNLTHQTVPQCFVCKHKQIIQLSCTVTQQRYLHTPVLADQDSLSLWQRIKLKMGFLGKLQISKGRLAISGCNLYICCTDCVDFSEFVKVLNIPDTFNSWFLLLQLHMCRHWGKGVANGIRNATYRIRNTAAGDLKAERLMLIFIQWYDLRSFRKKWMVNVRLSQMGQEGTIMKQTMYNSMWPNIEDRLKKFKDLPSSERREAMENYRSLMFLSILYYDEGLLGSDKQLANSLWVQLFAMDPNVGADQLELMVKYVRKQVYHHDGLDPLLVMKHGYISFLPLLHDKLDQKKALRDFNYVAEKQS